ncbi:caspase family protein [Azotobacter chroococcum]|uniref:caspase family protein n=1 Tax=Azotobacter chroococcum TaxID=353 RepID=UPI000B794C67|nr:caspase family protein [Azotobacter chroococcum]
MATPVFKRITLEQFEELLLQFPFTRQIDAVHMHHTWRPSHRDFKGHETIVGMWRFHTRERGWSDIAQHITIDPEGFIWLGRNWNRPPASAAGHNGNSAFGPFMFEMIGDFDKGHDTFAGAQRETALRVVALVQQRFDLPVTSLRFHNSMSQKSCPGSSLVYDEVVAAVQQIRALGRGLNRVMAAGAVGEGPFPEERSQTTREAIDILSRVSAAADDPADAELAHDDVEAAASAAGELQPAQLVRELSPQRLTALQPHVINLSLGRFSASGRISTTESDVDAIFEEHLVRALAEAKAQNRKLRLLFYAHGGLASESGGLAIAEKHIDWWMRNGVYPIYFVWETGLFESIGQMLKRAVFGSPRGFIDSATDLLIESAAEPLRGPQIWGEMKLSAERAAQPQLGGAWQVAGKLKAFCDAHPGEIELHAIGHSAGSIFHSHFLAAAHNLGVPVFDTLQLFAPAVRVDTFKDQLLGLLDAGKVARKLTLFTMNKHYEKDDNCAQLYRKSLLYLIFNALEDKRGTPILGLEECLRADADLKRLFGLDGHHAGVGEVVWSVSPSESGRSASHATAHGDFDDDPPTMNSAVRRILDLPDDRVIEAYPGRQRRSTAELNWADDIDWPEEFEPSHAALPTEHAPPLTPPQVQAAPVVAGPAAAGGRRSALCVGINDYPDPQHRLAGCVADARMWASSLSRLGFATTLLLDGQATREAIDRSLRAMVESARPGDVIVFQYSGHGTYVTDLAGDESDGRDEALCPVDFASGALYIDDDIAELFARLPEGVNLTCFTDCCHSGTNSRFAVGSSGGRPLHARDARRRFVPPTEEINRAHVQFRQRLGRALRRDGNGGTELMRDIKFAACRDDEVAWESDGHGEFSLHATRVLDAGIDGVSHEQFLQRVQADFGPAPRQHPLLDCTEKARSGGLLQPRQAEQPLEVDHALLMQTLWQLQRLAGQLSRHGR